MKSISLKIIIVYTLLASMPLEGIVSIVYNIKIAETTKRHGSEKQAEYPYMLVATPFTQFREKKDLITHQLYGGALGTAAYTKKTWYIKADLAGAHIRQRGLKCVSRNQTDDLLFTGGYSAAINKKIELTFSGLLGLPTHADRSIEGPQFGYAHVGLGGQIDGDFIYSRYDNSIRAAARFVHFFPRKSLLCRPELTTGSNHFNVHMGNLADLYFTHHVVFGKNSSEIGYNFTSFFNTKTCPALPDYGRRENFIRSSFFATYKYHGMLHSLPMAIALALSYGFDMKTKITSNKYVVTLWGSWSISF